MLNKHMHHLKQVIARFTSKKYGVIVLDIMDTIMGGGGVYPVVKRDGLDMFLQKYSYYHIVTFTDMGIIIAKDDTLKEVDTYFKELGITDKIEKRYFGWDMKEGLKNLELVAKDFSVDLKDIVFVGDGERDKESAERYGAKFVKVPSIWKEIEIHTKKEIFPETYLDDYKNIPNKFSFADLELYKE